MGPKVANCILPDWILRTSAFSIDIWMKREWLIYTALASKDIKGMQKFADSTSELGGIAQQYLFYYYREACSEDVFTFNS